MPGVARNGDATTAQYGGQTSPAPTQGAPTSGRAPNSGAGGVGGTNRANENGGAVAGKQQFDPGDGSGSGSGSNGSGSLPFTGFFALGVLASGLLALGGGLLVRRRVAQSP